ncbi:hypothetical protein Val02_37460 [Virgisporangium aliadipatigenens]|uniref:Uncharacterized protein n=1 Tax=Virgisporangium aliadipatigenens TaxID=741659 RepID=A0A8J3YN14_9ACTN|nr:hypothetical protein [Virgisporangium aliadipatigenens]GIJ46860.1 hypothetical protein Val02_37460 [Virgisporangium aliadipatigenens]
MNFDSWQVLRDGSGPIVDPESYLDRWVGDLVAHRLVGNTAAVAGFCAGNAFAIEMVHRIATTGGSRPALVMFDPEPVDVVTLCHQYRLAVDRMAHELGRRVASEPDVTHTMATPLSEVAADLSRRYEDAVRRTLDALGVEADLGVELVGHFDRYLDYLCAASRLGLPRSQTAAQVSVPAVRRVPRGSVAPSRSY